MNAQTAFLSPDTKGRTRLWIAFWIYGVLFSHLLFGGIALAYAQVDNVTLGLLLAAFLCYTAWIMRTIWVDADNTDSPLYSAVARYLTVAWAINAVLVSGFMFLAHWSGEPLPLPF